MERKGFSISEVIQGGWKAMKENLLFFIGFLIVAVLFQALPYIILSAAGYSMAENAATPPGLLFLTKVTHWVLMALVSMGFIKISLDLSAQVKPKWSSLVTCFPLVIKFLLGEILYAIVITIGFILLIIPGVIWGLKYYFFGYFIVDKGVGPMAAFEMSSNLTQGAKWDLLGFVVVGWIITLIGLICLGVGLFAAIPTVLVAKALVYRKLSTFLKLPEEHTAPGG